MILTPGTRLASATCDAQVIVVKAPVSDVDVRCGGAPMVESGQGGELTEPAADHADGTLMGRRYADSDLGLELLCTRGGAGSLSVGSRRIDLRESKPLPASD